jgi:hypothetical protein
VIDGSGRELFSVSVLFTPLMKISDHFATDITLQDYELEHETSS